MGSIKTGQILKQQTKSGGSIQSGRVAVGISSYDENIRKGIISGIKSQEEEFNRMNAEIEASNAEIERQNEEMKASYDKAVSDIESMSVSDYETYYYTIPSNIRDLFQSPGDIKQQLVLEKQNRADEALSTIQTKEKDWIAKRDYAQIKANNTSGDEGRDWSDRVNEANFWLIALNDSKGYATGDYAVDSVIDYATQKAQNLISNDFSSKEERRLRLINESNLIEQYKLAGVEPIYQQVGTEKILTGYKQPTITITEIPQNKITTGLSQAKIQSGNILNEQPTEDSYINQFGQQISYQPPAYNNKIDFFPTLKKEPEKTSYKQTTPFSKYDNPLAQTNYKSTKSNAPINLDMKIIDIPITQQRGTVGSPTIKIMPFNFEPIAPEEEVLGLITDIGKEFGSGVKKGAEDIFTKSLGQKLNKEISFNLPQETRGTMVSNTITTKYELPKPITKEVKTIYGSTSDLLSFSGSIAPEVLAWTYAAPVIAVPYIIQGGKKALNENLPQSVRMGGALTAGGALAFGYGNRLTKLIPKSIKKELPSNNLIIETTNIKVKGREPTIGVSQVNPVEVYTDEFGKTVTKYNYKIGSIIPEVAESTGKVTKIYKRTIARDLLGIEPKLIYSGNPYVDKLGYKNAIKELKLTGIKEGKAKDILRLTKPKYAESKISGEAYSLFGEDIAKPIVRLKTEQKVTPKIIDLGGVKTKNFESIDYLIKSKGVEVGSKGEVLVYQSLPEYTKTYMTKEGNIYSKLKQQGKTTEVYEQLTGIKSLGEKELSLPQIRKGEITLYHGTTETNAKDILNKGLLPKENYNEVYLASTPKEVSGFANRRAVLTGDKPVILEVNLPKSEYNNLLVKREKGIGGIDEVTLKNVKPKYIKQYMGNDLQIYKDMQVDTFKDISLSRKIIPKERKVSISKSNIITSNIDEPIIISSESPIKITKEIDTGTITGTNLKRGELTEQQKYIKNLGREGTVTELIQKPLNIVEDAKKSLTKQQQETSIELIKKSVPSIKLELKQPNIKEVSIIEKQSSRLSSSSLGLIPNKFQDMTGQGRLENLNDTGKIKSLGVFEGRLGGTSLAPVQKEESGTKLVNFKAIKEFTKELSKTKTPSKEETRTRIRKSQQPKFNQIQKEQPRQTTKQIDIITDMLKPKTITKDVPDILDPTKPTTTKPPIFKFKSKEETRKEDRLIKAFTVLIRSKGKVQEVGKGLSYSKAIKLGVERTKGSLAQTFALKESGITRERDISYRLPENLFTTPKRSKTRITPLTFVERRGTTLSERTEVSGLQQAKRSKQNRIRWL